MKATTPWQKHIMRGTSTASKREFPTAVQQASMPFSTFTRNTRYNITQSCYLLDLRLFIRLLGVSVHSSLHIRLNFDFTFQNIQCDFSDMTHISSSELRGCLKEADDKLKEWTLELEKAQLLLKEAKVEGDEELVEEARERITTAKEVIAQTKEDIKMYRKGFMTPPTAAVEAGRYFTTTFQCVFIKQVVTSSQLVV